MRFNNKNNYVDILTKTWCTLQNLFLCKAKIAVALLFVFVVVVICVC